MTIWDRGTYEELKWEPRKIEVHLHGERVDAPLRAVPDRQGRRAEELDDPPHGPAGGPDGGAHARRRSRRCSPGWATLPRDDDRWALRGQVGRRAGDLPLRAGPAAAASAATSTRSRRGTPSCARLNRALSHHRAILDGEVVAFDARRPAGASGALQQRMHLTSEAAVRRLAESAPVTYVALRPAVARRPRADRRALRGAPRAAARSSGSTGERWQTPDHVVGHGAELLAASREQGLEGDRRQAARLALRAGPALAARWVKVKNVQRQEVVIGGWLPGEGGRREPHRRAARRLATTTTARLRYAGRVGTGFTEDELDRLAALLAPLRARARRRSTGRPPSRRAARTSSGRELVAEVEFREWTAGRPAARARPTRGCATTSRRRRRARGAAERTRSSSASTAARCASPTRQGPVSRRPASRSATSSTTTRGSRRCCCRT